MPQNRSILAIPGLLSIALLLTAMAISNPPFSQSLSPAQKAERATPPTRDPNSPGYVTAKELPDGINPPATADGNFIIGPTHTAAPEVSSPDGIPAGAVIEFTMSSSESKIYP